MPFLVGSTRVASLEGCEVEVFHDCKEFDDGKLGKECLELAVSCLDLAVDPEESPEVFVDRLDFEHERQFCVEALKHDLVRTCMIGREA